MDGCGNPRRERVRPACKGTKLPNVGRIKAVLHTAEHSDHHRYRDDFFWTVDIHPEIASLRKPTGY
jgi:hypothetical protein